MTPHSRPARRQPRRQPLLALLALGLLATSAEAAEGGSPILPFGVFDFGAGILPPPSPLPAVIVRAATYRASKLREGGGRRSPRDFDLTVNSYGVALFKMTDIEILGARLGFGTVLPALDMKVDLGIPTPAGPLALSDSRMAQGDMQFFPALQWVSPGLFQSASFQVQAPTGHYDKDNLVNPGLNHWSFSPTYAFTYIHRSGFEVSSSIQLNFHSRNSATDYRSGVEYQHEFAFGQHVGPWTVGLGGYYFRQITDDKAPGLSGGNRARVAALGPALSRMSKGGAAPSLWFHAYKEFHAENRAQGIQLALRAGWAF